jgi:hypothetical protein
MTTEFRIKRGDLEPPLVINVSGSTGDLNGVVSWRVIGKQAGVVVFDDTSPTALITSPTTATITHEWVAGETNAVGKMIIETEAMWPGGRPQTFKPCGYNTIEICQDLN